MVDPTLLGLALTATVALCTATVFIINISVKVGRFLRAFDELKEEAVDIRTVVGVLETRTTSLDLKVERHLQWHDDVEHISTIPGE